jgi:hypothetical protein
MYCPQCGVHNEPKQSFCRQCGQPLVSVRLALEGRVDEVMTKFNKAEDLLAGGLLTFGIFVLGGIVSFFIGGLAPFAISIVLGLIICLPIVLKGLMRVDRLGHLLDPEKPASDVLLKNGRPAELLVAKSTDPLDTTLQTPGSVTDHTTLNLKTPGTK